MTQPDTAGTEHLNAPTQRGVFLIPYCQRRQNGIKLTGTATGTHTGTMTGTPEQDTGTPARPEQDTPPDDDDLTLKKAPKIKNKANCRHIVGVF